MDLIHNSTDCYEILETVINNSLIPQMIINKDGSFKLCNQACRFLFKKLWGIKLELEKFSWKDLPVDNSFTDAFLKDIELSFNGEIIVNQFVIKTNEDFDNEFYYEFQYFPVYQKNDEINSVCISALDITNMKRKESLLLDSININQSVFASLDEPFLFLNYDLTYYNANELFFRLFFVKRNEIEGFIKEKFVWNNKDISTKYLQNFKITNELLTYYCDKRDKKFYFQVSTDIINLNDKQIIFFVFKNITDLKNELKHSQLLLESIEKSSLGFMFFDENLQLTYSNANVGNFFDFSNDKFLKHSIEEILEKFPNNEFFKNIHSNLLDKTNWKGKIKVISNLNKEEILDTSIFCMQKEEKKIYQFMVIFRDATHEVHLEKHLRQAQKLEALGTLAGGIAHDFNNILTAMLGFTELCMMDVDDNDPQHFNLKQIQISANRAKDMINQILTFSRKTDIDFKPLIVNPIVKEAVKLLRASFPSSIKIEVCLCPALITVLGDPTQINQIVMNLATNALHAIKNRSGKVTVTLSLENIEDNKDINKFVLNNGKYALIKVSDTGCGIPEHVRSKIFDPYFTTKSSEEGTGLGLAVVHGIVSSLNGFIFFDTEIDKGTTFYVYIPFYEAQEIKLDNDEIQLNFGQGQKIILLDDESPIVNVNCQILKKINYIPYGFTDTRKAFDFYVDNFFEIDVVITDMTMPEINGLEFVKMIRELNPVIPIIICTGYSDLLEQEILDDNFLQIMHKPISISQLAEILKHLLKNKENY